MDQEQKKTYIEMKIQNINCLEKAKNIRKVSSFSIFVQRQIAIAKNKLKMCLNYPIYQINGKIWIIKKSLSMQNMLII